MSARGVVRRQLPWAGLVGGLVTAGCGFLLVAGGPGPVDRGVVPQPGTPAAAATDRARETPGPVVVPAPPDPPVAPPVRVHLPTLGVDAPVVPVDVRTDGALSVPDDPSVVGWWRAGSRPGEPTGSVVLDGHVDSRAAGAGAFSDLVDLRPGDPVLVETGPARVPYVVAGVRSHPKAELPAAAFDTSGPPRLVMITCGGSFDTRTRRYTDNVVVYAVPVPPGSGPPSATQR